jgi:hypothetical protein
MKGWTWDEIRQPCRVGYDQVFLWCTLFLFRVRVYEWLIWPLRFVSNFPGHWPWTIESSYWLLKWTRHFFSSRSSALAHSFWKEIKFIGYVDPFHSFRVHLLFPTISSLALHTLAATFDLQLDSTHEGLELVNLIMWCLQTLLYLIHE